MKREVFQESQRERSTVRMCLFATDLHGRVDRYLKLFEAVRRERPAVVFLGGDLFPMPWDSISEGEFLHETLVLGLRRLRDSLGDSYPRVLLILGNDDGKIQEPTLRDQAYADLWCYLHGRRESFAGYDFYGYSYVPPTPFQLKDWEKYDVGRYVPPGCVSPETGRRTVEVEPHLVRHQTIASDLQELAGDSALDRAVFLFHGPPYETRLDRAALDGKKIDHVPLDLHVGSIAVRRFIEKRQPHVTLHGHIHESARLTGSWRQRLGRTHMFGAAHDGPELALVRFALEDPERAERDLL